MQRLQTGKETWHGRFGAGQGLGFPRGESEEDGGPLGHPEEAP